ncbi:methylated-DNA--[protein]-cysteine S-methyltransferase [Limnobacter humi]|uniref:Methylated-DNA--[protein]-cysteine S-methyltransferase n=1 Tax=Limnobacter humi TaxID=1778671 RepID=A0ABT1WGW2_9BURK|nr:methylated-DNA--[protein]-cysteine S-methyltransferase [Limnobacter humi]MCQ8896624.1 methylated-DNA--[protein]-cysteine S-methyltransferase [Limnobacter humi]
MSNRTVKNHFQLVEQALHLIDREHQQQQNQTANLPPLSLAQLAEQMGISPFHLQRLFKDWTGISPQHFQHMLSRQRALEKLNAGQTVLMAALDAGLSATGQLHDLTIKLEAMTPGEIRQRGQATTLTVGKAESPMGWIFTAHTPRGLHRLEFAHPSDWVYWVDQLQTQWPEARFQTEHTAAQTISARIFETSFQNSHPIQLHLKATPFQLKVWEALIRLPPGYQIAYAQLAKALGMPKAARAVGSAVASNPVAVLIPCHRVIQSTGVLGEYRWGVHRKTLLNLWEDIACHTAS